MVEAAHDERDPAPVGADLRIERDLQAQQVRFVDGTALGTLVLHRTPSFLSADRTTEIARGAITEGPF
jgi:hypothetical protein